MMTDTKKHLVAVYGTLRRGCPNFERLSDAVFVREGRLRGYRMVNLGYYPGVVHDPDSAITVEMFMVDDFELQSLDWLEGYREECPERSHYLREKVAGTNMSIYVYNGDVERFPRVESGDWKKMVSSEERVNG